MTFDMPPDIPADKHEYEDAELQASIDEVRMICEESAEQEATALAKILEAVKALKDSHKLLHQYAVLLNEYDGGCRVIPGSLSAWIERCKEFRERAA